MIGEGINIRNKLRLPGTSRSAADPPRKRDYKAAVTALIGADLQQFGRYDAVKAGPVGQGVRMVQLAGNGGHQGDAIGFGVTERMEGLGKLGIIGHEFAFL